MARPFVSPLLLRASIVALAVALLVVAALLAPPRARADALIEAEPHPGQTVGEAPEMVLLRFDRNLVLRKYVHTVEVHDAQGERLDDGHASIAGYSPRTMIVRLAAPPEDGEVTVRYSVRFASTGDTLEGEFAFTVAPGFEAPPPTVEAGEPRSSQSIVLWTIAVVLAVALFASLLYYLQIETGTAQSSVEEPDPPDEH